MPFRKAPKSEEDVAMGAFNNWVLSYDNLSKLDEWLSDALCGVATGSGFAKRRLYSDDEENAISFLRPVMLSGLLGLHGKTDLADRVLKVTLDPIAEDTRRLESELLDDGRWGKAHPRILGALCEAVATALRNKGRKRLEKLPRMADFAQFVVDAEEALPWAPGAFLGAFRQAKEEQIDSLLESDPLANAVRILVDLNQDWKGTASELLERLAKLTTEARALPKTNRLQAHLKLLQPNLLSVGVEVEFERSFDRNRTRLIYLKKKSRASQIDGRENRPYRPHRPEPLSDKAFFADSSADSSEFLLSATPPHQDPCGRYADGCGQLADSSTTLYCPQEKAHNQAVQEHQFPFADSADSSSGGLSGTPQKKFGEPPGWGPDLSEDDPDWPGELY